MPTDASPLPPPTFALTRSAALARLEAFAPKAGSYYARQRNYDLGQDAHVHVSRLSAALRRRVITEKEVVAAALARHGPIVAEKFICEVFWRTYWKGWLEQRPSIWPDYLKAVTTARRAMETNAAAAERYEDACVGRSGTDCFDGWVAELKATGYLHNWARMQFASIWIFTLGLPWELGAEFMRRRLLDGDPASNTLSWRWVAGLHTVGKAYLADPERIRAMTNGRFAPERLARSAHIPADSIAVPPPSAPRQATSPDRSLPSLLLLTVEDLCPETVPALDAIEVRAVAFLPGETQADCIAVEDGVARAKRRWPEAVALGAFSAAVLGDAKTLACRQIVTGFAPVGPTAEHLTVLRQAVAEEGLVLAEYLRDWDRQAWPHCRKGFFALKEKIPALIDAAGLKS